MCKGHQVSAPSVEQLPLVTFVYVFKGSFSSFSNLRACVEMHIVTKIRHSLLEASIAVSEINGNTVKILKIGTLS